MGLRICGGSDTACGCVGPVHDIEGWGSGQEGYSMYAKSGFYDSLPESRITSSPLCLPVQYLFPTMTVDDDPHVVSTNNPPLLFITVLIMW